MSTAYAVARGESVLFADLPSGLYIGGEWVKPADGGQIDIIDPRTGETVGTAPAAGTADIDRAVAAGSQAFRTWSRTAPAERARILWRIADLLEQHGETLARLEALDVGMPMDLARELTAPRAADTFRYYAGWCGKIEGNTTQTSLPDVHAYTRREPYGVCAQIVPWNAPLKMAAWKIAPCLATGNVSVLKPAEDTNLTALFLSRIMAEAGVPPGVVNIVPGYGAVAGAALAAHPGVAKIAFTGSVGTGKTIAQAALGNLKKVTLELGGKSANVVFADADLDRAVAGSASAIFLHGGQVCVAASRLYVERSIYPEFMARLVELAKKIVIGREAKGFADLGPMVSERHMRRVIGMIETGVSEGATVLTGGERHGDEGFYVRPTILADAAQDSTVVREEIFGPVVVATPFDGFEDALRMANDSIYGLGASVWTRDLSKAHHFAAEVQSGMVWINSHGILDPHLPFGGYRQSGWGREFGKESIDAYTQMKTVVTQLDPCPIAS
ncbi:MAG: aldehyde dehydrogenase family protein [Sphingobium sp.]|jgi:phenylacetaldehyde dehydrogenase|nr:aldehyde dehydrogenase family protein [Sphingobium sp.]MCI1270730.1 aldehyde dehydrogenase family protein [Sphingobium sp.]MCI2053452.1 aldehyde dehydrogenase family protein [Sphingobium sp.]